MFKAFVTISGCDKDYNWDYIYPETLCEGEFEEFEDAVRFYGHLDVPRFGTVATYMHALNPDLIQIEAEYDIYEDDEPADGVEWFINEAIWYE